MNRSNFVSETSTLRMGRDKLILGKSHDYATDDVLSNFKRMSQLCDLLKINPARSAGDSARYLMLLKVDRWCNLVDSGKEPKNESVKDTVMDLLNYIDLAYSCDIDV